MARVLQRLVVVLAFAGAFLVAPALAHASVESSDGAPTPSGLSLAVTLLVAPATHVAPANACSLSDVLPMVMETPPPADEADDIKFGGMCDDRGACVVAPPRVHPLGSARIQAVRGCAAAGVAPAIGSGSDDAPGSGPAPAVIEHAVLDAADLIPPASSELGPAFPPMTGGPRVGVARGVERPPC